jgi:hypothetical protein
MGEGRIVSFRRLFEARVHSSSRTERLQREVASAHLLLQGRLCGNGLDSKFFHVNYTVARGVRVVMSKGRERVGGLEKRMSVVVFRMRPFLDASPSLSRAVTTASLDVT